MSDMLTAADRRRHAPADKSAVGWQESYFLGWVDLESLSAGSHHISLSPATGTAHVWSWLVADGHVPSHATVKSQYL